MRLATALVLLTAFLLVDGGCDKEGAAQAPAPGVPGSAAPAVPVVAVAKVISQKLSKPLRLPGELWAYRNVALHAKLQGFVAKIDVDRGSEVKERQLLIQLTAPEYEA